MSLFKIEIMRSLDRILVRLHQNNLRLTLHQRLQPLDELRRYQWAVRHV